MEHLPSDRAAMNGVPDDASSADAVGHASTEGASPRKNRWKSAGERVLTNIHFSRGFNTLRDMVDETYSVIDASSLETIDRLGEGAFAVVEKAWFTPPHGAKYMVAVKRLKPQMFVNATEFAMFVAEVALMRKLSHSHIVGFVGLGQMQQTHNLADAFVVQEYMAGGTLRNLITPNMISTFKTYNNADAVDMCIQMASGLHYLHSARPMVIHRDLKLENVLLKSEKRVDGRFVVKLADFGLSRAVGVKQKTLRTRAKQEASRRATSEVLVASSSAPVPFSISEPLSSPSDWTERAMSMMEPLQQASLQSLESLQFDLTGQTGSLMYMAPEVYREQPYNEKSDVFSFAMIMYEVLHKYIMLFAVAVRGTTAELEAYAARVADGYRPPLPASWPHDLQSLIQDCWALQPHDRPSMSQVLMRLEAIQRSGELAKMTEGAGCCSIS